MSNTLPDYKLIARALADTATAEDRERLQSWIAADPEHLRVWLLLREAWLLSGSLPGSADYSADADWPGVLDRIERVCAVDATAGGEAPAAARPGRRPAGLRWAGVRAALLAGLLVVPWLGWKLSRASVHGPSAVAEVSAPRGETRSLVLPDGSRVRLAAGSRLRHAPGLRGPVREVELDGMAYFDVAHDPDRPFVVRAGGATSRVVGTRFVVRAYAETAVVEVAVAQGRVAIRGSQSDPEVMLRVGQVGRIEEGRAATAASVESIDPYFAWTRGVLVLQDRPLSEALAELGRWYDAELKVEDRRLAARLIATTAGDAPLADVLAGIMLALDARYEQRGDTIVLVP